MPPAWAHATNAIHLIPWQRGDVLARGECGSDHLEAKLGADASQFGDTDTAPPRASRRMR